MDAARPMLRLTLAAALLLVAAPAAAQVNTERFRADAVEQGASGFVEGGLTFKDGNTELIEVGAGARVDYTGEVHQPFALVNATFGKAAGETFVNNAFGHLRWTAMWHRRVGSEVFGQVQHDQFTRLNLRVLGGAGVRGVLLRRQAVSLIAGTGAMFEHERLDLDPGFAHPRETKTLRSTSYLTLSVQLGDITKLLITAFVQPDLGDPADLRVLEEGSLEVTVTGNLSLVTALNLRYDTDPVDGVDELDLESITRLRVRF